MARITASVVLALLAACAVRPDFVSAPAPPEENASQAYADWPRAADPHSIADAYRFGFNVPEDMTQAAYWYERAADQGDADALLSLGHLHYLGEGVAQDFEKALLYFTRAAQAGLPDAHLWLGWMALDGEVQPVDPMLALDHLRIAAAGGNSRAMVELGHMYARGIGVAVDLARAERHYLDAAKNCDSHGVLYLGALYWKTLNDPRKALTWWESDEKTGLRSSAHDIGELYLSGALRETDEKVKALGWFIVGASRGDVRALEAGGALAAQLTPREAVAAMWWAEEFLGRHPGRLVLSGTCSYANLY